MKPLLLALAVMFALGAVFMARSLVVPTSAVAGTSTDN